MVVDQVAVWAVWRPQVGCIELWSQLLQQLDSVASAVSWGAILLEHVRDYM